MLLAGCSGLPHVVEPERSATAVRSTRIYVASHGWHAGIVVPAAKLNPLVPDLAKRFAGASHYEIGWGDKGFYQAQQVTTGLALQAMFWSEGAVLHVVAVPKDPRAYFPRSEVEETCLTDAEMTSLGIFLSRSFARDAAGRVVRLSEGIYGDSQFYDGEGTYTMLNTCNKWTAKALKSAGLDLAPAFLLTSGGVMSEVNRQRRQCD